MSAAEFPSYSYADELASPRQLNIGRDGSFGGIMRAVAGINYYSDAIGFGESTVFAKSQGMYQVPLGLQFFVDTGATCSNGAKMYEYVNTIPKGLGGRVGTEVQAMGLPNLRGLGPGIVEDAASALNPMPLLDTMVRGGYAQCKQVTMPVGDAWGNLSSQYDKKNLWIKDKVQQVNGKPHQTRWVFDKWITSEEYDKTPKTAKEGFENFPSFPTSQVAVLVLLATLLGGIYLTKKY